MNKFKARYCISWILLSIGATISPTIAIETIDMIIVI